MESPTDSSNNVSYSFLIPSLLHLQFCCNNCSEIIIQFRLHGEQEEHVLTPGSRVDKSHS